MDDKNLDTQRKSKPEERWMGEYGESWTKDFENRDVEEAEKWFKKHFGRSKRDLLERFLDPVDKDARILEVGANVGAQLSFLSEMGFTNLYGIDIQEHAVHQSRPELNVIQGNMFDIPFKDGYFDLVFTHGTLIHSPPDKIDIAVNEISRCSNRWIFGHEYYADSYVEIKHRGEENVLWKTDFPSKFSEKQGSKIVDIEYLEYNDNDNVDVEYLIKLD